MDASHRTVAAGRPQGGLATAGVESQRAPYGSRTANRPSDPHARVAGLVFDMDDVLYDATLWRRWLLQLLSRLGVKADYRTFYRSWDEEFLVEVHRGRREYAEALQAFLLAQGLSWAQIDEVEAASLVRCEELETGARPLPGVTATIDQLTARGIALAVLTDSPHPAGKVEERLERLGLGGRFQAVLSSLDLEATKPASECYQAALDALGLGSADVLYVGHESQDLAGAAAFGLKTAALNHDDDAHADLYLTRFAELLEIIGS